MRNRVGKFYDVGGTGSFGIAVKPEIGTDESEMSATAIITTPQWDRQNDSVDPMLLNLKNYTLNPVVFFDHGLQISQPIAKSDDENGKLWVFPSQAGVVAKSFFSQRNKISEQFFALVCDKILRGTSVRFSALEAPKKKSQGTAYGRTTLEEWSWTGLGVNPESVMEVVKKCMTPFSNTKIDGSVLKSMQSLVTMVPNGTRKVKSKLTATGNMLPNILEKPMAIKSTEPFGKQITEAIHSRLKSFSEELESTQLSLEHPGVVKLVDYVNGEVTSLRKAVQGSFQEHYPKSVMKGCGAEKEEMSVEKMMSDEEHMSKYSDEDKKKLEEDDSYQKSELKAYSEMMDRDKQEAKLKSFLQENSMDRHRFSATTSDLQELSQDMDLPESVRSRLKSIAAINSGIVNSALSQPSQPSGGNSSGEDDELETKRKSLAAELLETEKRLAELKPAPRP
jgi:hypothetical protein